MAYIDYYKVLGVDKSATQDRLSVSWPANTILT